MPLYLITHGLLVTLLVEVSSLLELYNVLVS